MTTSTLARLMTGVDRDAVQREADELREQLADCEALLRLIDRHASSTTVQPVSALSKFALTETNGADRHAVTNGHNGHNGNNGNDGNGHAPLSVKRAALLAIMQARPGRWTTAELRDKLAEQGIDPQSGTPVKNVMWHLAKDGTVHSSGAGVYEFPALNVRVDTPDQEAMGL